jgi:hypothetical protein
MLQVPEANFEETFGENKAADAWFILGTELKEPDKVNMLPISSTLATFEIFSFQNSL